MKNEIELKILKGLIRDVYSRYELDQMFRASDQNEQRIILSIYESWREVISTELYNNGVIDEKYKPRDTKSMPFIEVANLHDFYITYGLE